MLPREQIKSANFVICVTYFDNGSIDGAVKVHRKRRHYADDTEPSNGWLCHCGVMGLARSLAQSVPQVALGRRCVVPFSGTAFLRRACTKIHNHLFKYCESFYYILWNNHKALFPVSRPPPGLYGFSASVNLFFVFARV